MQSVKHALTYVAVAALAAGAGLLIGLLYAPVSGREARHMMARRLNEGREAFERTRHRALADVKEYMDEKVEAGREAIAHLAG